MKNKRLFFDLETSMTTAWVWRTGKQYVGANQIIEGTKIISAHWSWDDEDEVHNVHWGLNKQDDKRVIKALIKQMDKATEIVAHNGDKFDMKWVRSRAIYHGLEMKTFYKTIDTYKMAKSKLNLPSYSLKEICKYFGLEAKKDPGGFETWYNIQFNKDREALEHLLYYGDGDIVSLKAVYNKFCQYYEPTTHYGVKMGLDRHTCPECGNDIVHYRGKYVTKMGTISHYLRCSDIKCNKSFKVSNKVYEDWIKYRYTNGLK